MWFSIDKSSRPRKGRALCSRDRQEDMIIDIALRLAEERAAAGDIS
jgi:hypothetical protein